MSHNEALQYALEHNTTKYIKIIMPSDNPVYTVAGEIAQTFESAVQMANEHYDKTLLRCKRCRKKSTGIFCSKTCLHEYRDIFLAREIEAFEKAKKAYHDTLNT